MAERRGFEPLIQMNRITVFETAAFDRSAISPQKQDYNLACEHEKIKDEPQKTCSASSPQDLNDSVSLPPRPPSPRSADSCSLPATPISADILPIRGNGAFVFRPWRADAVWEKSPAISACQERDARRKTIRCGRRTKNEQDLRRRGVRASLHKNANAF